MVYSYMNAYAFAFAMVCLQPPRGSSYIQCSWKRRGQAPSPSPMLNRKANRWLSQCIQQGAMSICNLVVPPASSINQSFSHKHPFDCTKGKC